MAAKFGVLGVCLLAFGAVGCATMDTYGESPGVISGTIAYAGAASSDGRPLAIAIYDTYPPQGPPVRSVLVEQYAFPYAFVFAGLLPGTYYVGALIDVDRMDTRYTGMLNTARDPYGYANAAAPIELQDDRGIAGVEVELEDPTP